MDLGVFTWIVVPLGLLHLVCWRRGRHWLALQLVVDVLLLLLPGRLLLQGWHLGPGAPGSPEWGGVATLRGSPEQIDLPLQFEVWWEEVRRLAAAGEPPWISDRIGGGAPLLANGQTNLPSPAHLPVWFLGARRGSDVMVIWKLELAALGAFALFRRWRLRPVAAATGALAFAFGLYPLSWAVVPLAWVVTALPWTLWALAGALRGRRMDGAIAAVLLGVSAGWSVHPETAGFLWLATASAGVTLAWGRWRRLARLVLPGALALAVAALGAVPTVLTVRQSAKLAEISAAPAYPLPAFTWEVRHQALARLIVPWRDGHPADGSFRPSYPAAVLAVGVGSSALVLLLAGASRRRVRRQRLMLLILGGWAAVLVLEPPGLSELLSRVPVLGVMTWPRAGLLPGLVLAGLAALGCDAVLRRPSRWRLIAATTAVQAVLIALVLTADPQAPRRHLLAGTIFPALTSLAVTPWGGALLPALVAAEACVLGWQVLPASPRAVHPPDGSLLASLASRAKSEPGRILALHAVLPPNRAALAGLSELGANDPVRTLPLTRLHHALGSEGLDLPGPVTRPWAGLSGAWGVRWLATPPQELSSELIVGWEEVEAGAGGRVLRNTRTLPELRLVSRIVPPPGDPATGAWEELDFESVAVGDRARTLGGSGRLELIERRPWRWHATVRCDGPVLAVLHVPWAPGWRAFVGEQEAAIEIVNLAAMAVEVEAGEHRVTWRYSPPGWVPGALVGVIGLLGCLGACCANRRERGSRWRRMAGRPSETPAGVAGTCAEDVSRRPPPPAGCQRDPQPERLRHMLPWMGWRGRRAGL